LRINILDYLDDGASLAPGKAAFVSEEERITFGELRGRAKAAGTFISSLSLYKEPVVVFMERNPSTIAAFFGTMYGGCFYVPVDSEMPLFRIKLIFEKVNPKVIVCDKKTIETAKEIGCGDVAHLFDEIIKTPVDEEALAKIRARAIDADPVYVVFTSGSTGIPKGVIASHRSVIDYVENLCEVMRFDSETVFGMQIPLYVDACLKEIFPTLKHGACAYLIPKRLFMFPVKLLEYIEEKKINTVCWVVSALAIVSSFGALDKIKLESLRTVAFGSEVFPVKQFNKWKEALPSARFVHLYGPTEATGMSAYYEADRLFGEAESIPIGKPFNNTEIILLDEKGNEPACGERGEICIRGAGLSLGYYRDAERTREAFVQNPLSDFPDIIYKTGDVGTRGEDGSLYYICRGDQQIKHMGHRVELGEIEAAAARCDGVRMACAVYAEEQGRIILYYCAEDGLVQSVLAEYLKKLLPRYMLPYAYVPIDALPQTPNGKVDRVGLLSKYRAEAG